MRTSTRLIVFGGQRPSLDLNFLNESVPGDVTFSGGANGTRVNRDGSIVAATTPRFDYDPVSLACKGLLIEEQRTNLLLNSKLDGTSLSTQSVTVTNAAHTLSFYGTGTVTLSGVSTAGPLVGSGVYPTRSTLTFTPTAGSLTLTVTGSVQFAQLELGALATSPIPTAGAAVTRTADSVTMTGSNFSSWYRQDEGTFVIEQEFSGGLIGSALESNAIVVDNGTTDERIVIRTVRDLVNPQMDVMVITGGVVVMDSGGLLPVLTNVTYKRAVALRANDCQHAYSGLTPAGEVDSSVAMPVGINRLLINGINSLMWLRRLRYFPRRIPNSKLQALAA